MDYLSLKDEIIKDYQEMMGSVALWMEKDSKELLIIQSIEGHVREGHCAISISHPNFTIEDTVLALNKDPDVIKSRRQREIDEFFTFMDRVINGETKKYETKEGRPLFGYKIFEKYSDINDTSAMFVGLYLGGLMDDPDVRRECEKAYRMQLRQGLCCLVNIKNLEKERLSLRDLANFCFMPEEVGRLESLGIIHRRGGPIGGDYTFGYVQLSHGVGTSDDLAILTAGVLYGLDAALGVFLADAVDTWDKYVPYVYGSGQDSQIPSFIEQKEEYIRKNVNPDFTVPSKKDVLKFVSHIAKSRYRGVKSASQRYLNQLTEGIAPIDNYLNVILGKPAYNLRVGPKSVGMSMKTELAVKQLFSHLNRTEKKKLGRNLTARFR